MSSFEGEANGGENPEAIPVAAAMLNTLPKKGVVVYDATTGDVKHLHLPGGVLEVAQIYAASVLSLPCVKLYWKFLSS
jgi:hypothetical protein